MICAEKGVRDLCEHPSARCGAPRLSGVLGLTAPPPARSLPEAVWSRNQDSISEQSLFVWSSIFFFCHLFFPLTMKDKEWMLQNFQCISKLIFYFSINYILLQITMTDRNHLHWVDQLFQVTNIHAPSTARALILRKDATNCFVRVKIVCCKM